MEPWREELYSKNELYHHGIKGQKWGRRNGVRDIERNRSRFH